MSSSLALFCDVTMVYYFLKVEGGTKIQKEKRPRYHQSEGGCWIEENLPGTFQLVYGSNPLLLLPSDTRSYRRRESAFFGWTCIFPTSFLYDFLGPENQEGHPTERFSMLKTISVFFFPLFPLVFFRDSILWRRESRKIYSFFFKEKGAKANRSRVLLPLWCVRLSLRRKAEEWEERVCCVRPLGWIFISSYGWIVNISCPTLHSMIHLFCKYLVHERRDFGGFWRRKNFTFQNVVCLCVRLRLVVGLSFDKRLMPCHYHRSSVFF